MAPSAWRSQSLHLRPRSYDTQRVWHMGEIQRTTSGADRSELRLTICPDQHASFSSLRAILAQLKPYAQSEHQSALAKIDTYVREACPELSGSGTGTHGQLLANCVTFAIMRRLSRESVYTARLIDLSARVINSILSQIPHCRQVHVDHVDRLDRPTLKVLARAMLLLEVAHGFSWIWHSSSDPTAPSAGTSEDSFLASRRKLLQQLVGILAPRLTRHAGIMPLTRPKGQPRKVSTDDASAALVIQNYDACFLWCDLLVYSGMDTEVGEGFRLMGLAAVNIGKVEESLHWLRLAEGMATGAGRRAHLCYLQGLVEAKRSYDLRTSTAQYERGLTALEADGADGEDLPLERAWLLNGLALNEAILWRRSPGDKQHYARAFHLVRDAFHLVRDGEDPARRYLRFNLIANAVFLLEMQGKYNRAIDTLRKTFDFGLTKTSTEQHSWQSTIAYRTGILHYRAGQLDEAYRDLHEAAAQDAAIENGLTQERILRALGVVALCGQAIAEAEAIFTRGLEICRDARSAEGTREHALGLIAALLRGGKERKAREVYETLVTEEGLEVVPAPQLTLSPLPQELMPSAPSSKLPAYLPETDLEDIRAHVSVGEG
jgi:tetratricopeptide (TPR) repeat protein